MANILFLSAPAGLSSRMRYRFDEMLRAAQITSAQVHEINVHLRCPDLLLKQSARKTVFNTAMAARLDTELQNAIAKYAPRVIIINDTAVLWHVAKTNCSLAQCRGSVYMYCGIPCIVLNDLKTIFVVKYGSWVMLNDLQKVKRWHDGKMRHEPKFNYKVCTTEMNVSVAEADLRNALMIAIDIETSTQIITCIGYAAVWPDGRMFTYVIPFVNSQKANGCHWETEEAEENVWRLVQAIHANDVPKAMQNGATYDATYFLRYRCPLKAYYFDTMHLMRALYIEAPKKLGFLASMFLDNCRYWKDEIKGEKDERYPGTPERQERYWRYNAMDCHNTLLIARYLIVVINNHKLAWARYNYRIEFAAAVGPALRGSMCGLLVDRDRQRGLGYYHKDQYECELEKLLIMVADQDFNPRSPDQVAQLLYDVLNAKPIELRGAKNSAERSTDERMLKLIAQQHWLLKLIIEQIWRVKKPMNNYSKYANYHTKDGKATGMALYNDRFMYSLKAGGTETWRYSGSKHSFKYGTNPQNVPNNIRPICVADPGYVFFEPDYAQSDARFVAYHSGDPKMIQILESGEDAHSRHAEQFFKKSYEDIMRGKEEKADWVIHPIKGVRQNAKRIGHGANYQMSAFTLYVTMGKEAVIGSAESLHATIRFVKGQVGTKAYIHIPAVMEGNALAQMPDAKPPLVPQQWTQNQLVKFCDMMLEEYHVLYKFLRPWFARIVQEAIRNGNKATNAFGQTRLFFGDIAKDTRIQRELTAFYGQAGTAGNINRALHHFEYHSDIYQRGVIFCSQTHDSLLFMLPIVNFHQLAQEILTVMEMPFTIGKAAVRIPADGKIGLTWGEKAMLSYKPGLTLLDLQRHEEKMQLQFAKYMELSQTKGV